jgi:hypothetical protein
MREESEKLTIGVYTVLLNSDTSETVLDGRGRVTRLSGQQEGFVNRKIETSSKEVGRTKDQTPSS